MEKKLLIEEITRLQEMMGVKKNLSKLITEALSPGRGAFDFNGGIKSGIRSELQNAVEEWGQNTAQLTRNGNRATFDELLEQGRLLARNAGDTASDANALYYLARATGPDGYSNLLGRLSLVNRSAFDNQVNKLTDATLQRQFKNGMQSLFISFPWRSASSGTVQNTKNALRMLETSIDSSSIDATLKNDLKAFIREQEQLMDGAMETSTTTTTLRPGTDINTSSTAGRNVSDIEALEREALERGIRKEKLTKARKSVEASDLYRKLSVRQKQVIKDVFDNYGNETVESLIEKAKLQVREYAAEKNISRTGSGKSKVDVGGIFDGLTSRWKPITAIIVGLLILGGGLEIADITDFVHSQGEEVVDRAVDRFKGEGENNEEGFNAWCDTKGYECKWSDDGYPEVKVNGKQTFAEYGEDGWKLI
jgi:hypothetical protein